MSGSAHVAMKTMSLKELHVVLGHISAHMIKDLYRHGRIPGIQLTDTSTDFECRPCILAKSTHKHVPKVRKGGHAYAFADEVHSDLWGPAHMATLGRRLYYISFTDDWSRWSIAYPIHAKSDVFYQYKVFVAWVKTQMGFDIKCLHTDHGREYMSDAFITYLDEHGTEQKLTVHDTPEENGVAERLNRMLMEKVRAMMITCQLPDFLWGEALNHAVWLKNRTWT